MRCTALTKIPLAVDEKLARAHDVVVEYWGLIGALDNGVGKRYEKSMRWKMAQYHSRDIKFISIYEYG